MIDRAFISITGNGLARASHSAVGDYVTEPLLDGSDVRCLAADPLNAERVYAGTQGTGVLRSDDRGRTWRAAGLSGQTVMAIAASPTQQDVVYAGTRPALFYRSTNGGASWDELPGFRRIPWRWLWRSPAEKPFTAYVQGIALSPTDPDRIVVGIEAGATVVSSDCGNSWTGHIAGSLRDCHNVAFHRVDGEWVYEAGGTGGGAAFSRDGGRTWSRSGQGMDRHYGWAVAADPIDPSIWYVSAAPGPYKAHGGKNAEACIFRREGATWQRVMVGHLRTLPSMPYALLVEAGIAGSLCAGLSNGEIWHSRDYGEHWAQLPISLGQIRFGLLMV